MSEEGRRPKDQYDDFMPKTKDEMWNSLVALYPDPKEGKISVYNACNSIEELRNSPFVQATEGSSIIIGCLLATIGKMCRQSENIDIKVECIYCKEQVNKCYVNKHDVCFDCVDKEDQYNKESDELTDEEIHRKNNPQYYEN